MRILITSPIFPPDLGGPSTYVPSLAKDLTERGHEVTLDQLQRQSALKHSGA